MRTTIAILACLVLLAACGGEDLEAKKAKISDLKKKYREANAELVTLMEKNSAVKTTSFKAAAYYKAAKRKGDEDAIAAAKARMEEAGQAAQEAIDAENALHRRIRELKDKIRKLGGKI